MKRITEFTEEQKTGILDAVKAYLNKHEAFGGEMVCQDDDAQIDGISLCSDLADIVSFEFCEDDEYEGFLRATVIEVK
jgi:hypothetical protein